MPPDDDLSQTLWRDHAREETAKLKLQRLNQGLRISLAIAHERFEDLQRTYMHLKDEYETHLYMYGDPEDKLDTDGELKEWPTCE